MKKTLIILSSLLSASTITIAQNRPGAEARPAAGQSVTIASFTQNMKKYDGYFNFYYDDKSGKMYLEIDKFDTEFLYFSSLVSGVGNGNSERGGASSAVTKFVKMGPKIFLIQPVTAYRAVNGNADEKKAVEANFAKSVLFAFTAVATEGGKSLVDLTSFIVRDVMKVGDGLGRGSAVTGGGGYRLDDSRSVVYMDNTKNFPKNTEFEAMLTFAGSGRGRMAPDNSSVTLNEHQAFVELPPLAGYKMRKFDPRAGFFAFQYLDFAAPMTEPINKKFTERHRLAKKDPSAAVSEAVEPIVYYIDRGAQPIIKKALMEGGAWWNQAFEAAGYKNAFIVKELPEGADPMDIRYNVVNWVTRSGSPTRAFSYGASYIDPRTGEIIKGVVTLGSDRHREDFLIAEGLLQPYVDGKPIPKQMEEMALARIRQLSAHEIGHTLGLTHNFAASFKDRASVMDYPYPRFNLKTDGTIDLSDAYAKGIGTWDKRAIIWGYSDFAKGVDEDAALDKIMKQTLAEGHQYIPDIGGYAHPMSNQWEDGTNPIDQLNKLMKVRRHVLDNFSEKAIPKDAPMATLNEVLVPMYLLHRFQVEAVAKWIGGLYFTHAVKNDGQAPTKMVDPAEQWRAFDALMATITPDALALPEELIKKIPPRPEGFPGSVETFSGNTGPTFDPIAAAESAAGATLDNLLMSERAARIIEYNARDAKNPSLLAIVDKMLDLTWKAPLQPGYKGELQIMVNNLILKKLLGLAADSSSGENVRGEALLKVTELKDWMAGKLTSTQGKEKATLLFGLQQIGEFEKDPNKFQPTPVAQMPPGAPIGMPDRTFEVFERY
ncbi:zinc-dependent metalloprotease [Mucilaginibacter myungsuensis]|uniref:Zinc-dependent metalloprotease n=1 Tax=Mucilaginibacter myungsuensis TaxID=649104 RepID=A0A929PZD3_9SPHI|nr:zinc-dependent metalloprotease [Mucilaginibacter myungsuensis]MBE9664297.1 zinc-dependent metalloprotease [Mucilaginibacter myungsuensis]MDN3597006.1 zinc-dependent metalloprotease [Mucilaginibacter myungsuensis]